MDDQGGQHGKRKRSNRSYIRAAVTINRSTGRGYILRASLAGCNPSSLMIDGTTHPEEKKATSPGKKGFLLRSA